MRPWIQTTGARMVAAQPVRQMAGLVRFAAVFLSACMFPAAFAQTPAAIAASPAQAARFANIVEGRECLECHVDATTNFALSAHGKAAKFLKSSQATSCATCHGDGRMHVETGRPSQISSPGKLPAAQASALCLTCHSRDETHAGWLGSPHDRRDMTCVSCHKEHHTPSEKVTTRNGLAATALMRSVISEKLLKSTPQELCLSCHKDKRKATLQRSSHLIQTEHGDSKITCSSCHNPHGGETRTMLVASSTNELCYNCHAEKRGPFLWEHAPGRSDCNTCHVPHGSNNPTLLKARVTVLCQNCHMHMLWRHQTVAGYDISSFNKGCVNCHSQVHGSNHPSGKTFTR